MTSAGATQSTTNTYRGVAVQAALCCVCCLLFASAAWAQDRSPRRLEGSRFPLGHRFRNRAWTPLLASLVNDSEHAGPVQVVFTLSVGGRMGQQVSFSRTIRLPANSRREVGLDVFLDLDTESLLERFEDPKTGRIQRREEEVAYPDGSSVLQYTYRLREPFRAQVELYEGAGGGRKLSQTEMYSNVVHPDGLGVFLVEAYPEPWRLEGPTYRRDGHEYVYGEIDEDIHRKVELAGGFGGRNAPPPANLDGRFIAKGSAHVSLLPRKWAAYQSVHAIVLASPRDHYGLLGLDPLQRSSLLEWLWSGGRLVIVPSVDPESFAHPFFEKILPVRLTGQRRQHEAAPLTGRYGGELPYRTDLPHWRAEALPGEADPAIARDGQVWLARRQVWGGVVGLRAHSGWAVGGGRRNLDGGTGGVRRERTPGRGLGTAWADRVPGLMQQLVGMEAPGRVFGTVLLVGYWGLATAALRVLRRRGRGELGWGAMLVLAVVGLGAAIQQGRAAGEETGLVQGETGVSELGNRKGVASAIGFVSVYSPSAFTADARFHNPDTLATAYGGGAGEGERSVRMSALNVEEGERFRFRGLSVNEREVFTCGTMAMADYGEGVAVDFGCEAEGVAGAVDNRTGRDLIDCILVADRAVYRIGALPAGAVFQLNEARRAEGDRLSSEAYGAGEAAKTRSRILALVRRPPKRDRPHNAEAVASWPATLYAWLAEPQAKVSFGEDREPEQRAWQLLCLPTDRIEAPARGTVRPPPGTPGLVLRDHGARRAFGHPSDSPLSRMPRIGPTGGAGGPSRPGMPGAPGGPRRAAPDPELAFRPVGWLDGQGPTSIEVGFRLPPGLEGARVTDAWVHCDVVAREMVAEVSVLDRSVAKKDNGRRRDRWIPLEMEIEGGRARIPDPERCLGPDGRPPVVRLRIRPEGGPGAARGLAGAGWTIRTLDLEATARVPERRTRP